MTYSKSYNCGETSNSNGRGQATSPHKGLEPWTASRVTCHLYYSRWNRSYWKWLISWQKRHKNYKPYKPNFNWHNREWEKNKYNSPRLNNIYRVRLLCCKNSCIKRLVRTQCYRRRKGKWSFSGNRSSSNLEKRINLRRERLGSWRCN